MTPRLTCCSATLLSCLALFTCSSSSLTSRAAPPQPNPPNDFSFLFDILAQINHKDVSEILNVFNKFSVTIVNITGLIYSSAVQGNKALLKRPLYLRITTFFCHFSMPSTLVAFQCSWRKDLITSHHITSHHITSQRIKLPATHKDLVHFIQIKLSSWINGGGILGGFKHLKNGICVS